jgi:hypothetical protein
MHAFKFSLIVVLSCIAMIGAVPVGNRAPAKAIVRRLDGLGGPYRLVLQLQHAKVLTRSKIFLKADSITPAQHLMT